MGGVPGICSTADDATTTWEFSSNGTESAYNFASLFQSSITLINFAICMWVLWVKK